MAADDFWIAADGQRFTSKGAVVDVNSDRGDPTYTTLELIWTELGREMRLFIYFNANPTGWWSAEMRTYNAQAPDPDWLYYRGAFFNSAIGAAYRGDVDLTNAADDPFRGELHFHGLVLSTTLSGGAGSPDAGPALDAVPGCVNQVWTGGANDCSYGLPLPCAPCIACNPLPPGDNGGCVAPDIYILDWHGGAVDFSLRYPVGCVVSLPTQNPLYPGFPQTCTCVGSGTAGGPPWVCPV